MKKTAIGCLCLLASILSSAQSARQTLYPSLLWEITGNGLTKPSYLFGTMHVSNKMVFHLSDSFYRAIGACDMVALEIDPRVWERQMSRVVYAQSEMADYMKPFPREYMREHSFRIYKFEDAFKGVLREEPMVIDGLLYRNYYFQSDFLENTYLDLYVYQTARRLGKSATGVEDYLVSERLALEGTREALKERAARKILPEGETIFTIQNKIQSAYRRGDLDLLDSLSTLISASGTFMEKFLYRRNEIQAASIDSIVRRQSLFVAVGAAHLPGKRGVIELLRRKGYVLRPISMPDNDGNQREALDKTPVPVDMRPVATPDGVINCLLPGQWIRRSESQVNEGWQYADMDNGCYYMLTRLRTHSGIWGSDETSVLKAVDSLLYDNIPGKILKKNPITVNGYAGFDIVNRTRRGDIQRYNIIITSSEILIFKMSGIGEYVSGKEADQFFSSIRLNEPAYGWADYSPSSGGFSVSLPQAPRITYSRAPIDQLYTWEYEGGSPGKEAYLIIRKSIHNYQFLEEDSIDLDLIEESFKGSSLRWKEVSRKFGKLDGYDCLDMLFDTKDGGTVRAKAVIKGTDYFLLVARSGKDKSALSRFFDSFHFVDYRYGPPGLYSDTSLHFSVLTSVKPVIDADLVPLMKGNAENSLSKNKYNAETVTRWAYFRSDSTGEAVSVAVSEIPVYFHRKDSLLFWENEMRWKRLRENFILQQKTYFNNGDSVCGYRYTLLDTNTNRKIKGMIEVKSNTCYRVVTETDQLHAESPFIKDIFSSFSPAIPANGFSVFASKAPLFFREYHSVDTAARRIAQEAIPHIIFERADLDSIKYIISRMSNKRSNYVKHKVSLIHAIGKISDTCCMEPVIAYVKQLYDAAGDTASFQNAAIRALAHIQTKESYAILKEIMLKRPPVFDNAKELQELFQRIGEDPELARTLFPEITRLVSIEDYKAPLTDLLYSLVDSNVVQKEAYSDLYPSLLRDAQVLLKKQQGRDEKNEGEGNPADADEIMAPPTITTDLVIAPPIGNVNKSVPGWGRVVKYALLLMPFYDDQAVQQFFQQALLTKDLTIKMGIAVLMIRNGKLVPDEVLDTLAANDRYRVMLYEKLEKIGKASLVPARYRNQEAMARSLLVRSNGVAKITAMEPAGKKVVLFRNTKGTVYFFTYKLQGAETSMIGISGLQPADPSLVSANGTLVSLTRKRLTADEPEQAQFEHSLRELMLSKRKSALLFFSGGDAGGIRILSR